VSAGDAEDDDRHLGGQEEEPEDDPQQLVGVGGDGRAGGNVIKTFFSSLTVFPNKLRVFVLRKHFMSRVIVAQRQSESK